MTRRVEGWICTPDGRVRKSESYDPVDQIFPSKRKALKELERRENELKSLPTPAELIAKVDNASPEEGDTFEYAVHARGTQIRNHYFNMETIPTYSTTRIDAEFVNGSKCASVILRRRYTVIGERPRLKPFWDMHIMDFSDGSSIGKEIKHESRPIDTYLDGVELKKTIESMLSIAAHRVLPLSQSFDAIEEAIDSISNFIKSVETVDQGVLQADRIGFSFFGNSDDMNLRVAADWSETNLSPRMIREALFSDQYKFRDPSVEVKIQDSLAKNSKDYWTATFNDGIWTLVSNVDGKPFGYPKVDDVEELLDYIEDVGLPYSTDDFEMLEKYMEEMDRELRSMTEEHAAGYQALVDESRMHREESEKRNKRKKRFKLFR